MAWDILLHGLRGNQPCQHLDLSLLDPRAVRVKPAHLWALVMVALETNPTWHVSVGLSAVVGSPGYLFAQREPASVWLSSHGP